MDCVALSLYKPLLFNHLAHLDKNIIIGAWIRHRICYWTFTDKTFLLLRCFLIGDLKAEMSDYVPEVDISKTRCAVVSTRLQSCQIYKTWPVNRVGDWWQWKTIGSEHWLEFQNIFEVKHHSTGDRLKRKTNPSQGN